MQNSGIKSMFRDVIESIGKEFKDCFQREVFSHRTIGFFLSIGCAIRLVLVIAGVIIGITYVFSHSKQILIMETNIYVSLLILTLFIDLIEYMEISMREINEEIYDKLLTDELKEYFRAVFVRGWLFLFFLFTLIIGLVVTLTSIIPDLYEYPDFLLKEMRNTSALIFYYILTWLILLPSYSLVFISSLLTLFYSFYFLMKIARFLDICSNNFDLIDFDFFDPEKKEAGRKIFSSVNFVFIASTLGSWIVLILIPTLVRYFLFNEKISLETLSYSIYSFVFFYHYTFYQYTIYTPS